METIFAQASAPGKAGVSVIRLSGPDAFETARRLTGRDTLDRGFFVADLRGPTGEFLDQAVVMFFAGPASFTGEDVVELHLHGSIAVVSVVLSTLSGTSGLRMAEPGEFTRRALENGKMDLAQVEGLADLIDAETEVQRRQATRVLAGELGKKAAVWRRKLVRAAALIEATIDFADEDVPEDVTPEVLVLIESVRVDLVKQIQGVRMSERIRHGFEVAIVGPPNVGKSTLLNALAGRSAAIISQFAGTTRDVIEVRMDMAGLAVTLLDTAGLRATDDHVEKIGISMALERAETADIRVFLADSLEGLDVEFRQGDLHVFPKADLREDQRNAISGKTGAGLESLISNLTEELTRRSAGAGLAIRERHEAAMATALHGLGEAQENLRNGSNSYDVAADSLRHSILSLESLVGRVDVEHLLDEIFSSFCLGK